MGKTSIEWTSKVWNPLRGCSVTSPGCTNCYAMKFAHRFNGAGQPYEGLTRLGARGPVWTGEVRPAPEMLLEPLRWKQPCRIFVNSMSDLFHEDVSTDYIARVFAVMAIGHWHTFQVLTKRAARMRAVLSDLDFIGAVVDAIEVLRPELHKMRGRDWGLVSPTQCELTNGRGWPLPNVWPGVSVENQRYADERLPDLHETPAAIPWVSFEPLLGGIDLARWLNPACPFCEARAWTENGAGSWYCYACGTPRPRTIRWAVVGGESGPHARPMHPMWARSIRDQCQAAETPFFFKQWGEWMPRPHDDPKTDYYAEGVKHCEWVFPDGERSPVIFSVFGPFEHEADEGGEIMDRVGKKAAGNVLDGRTWEEFPDVEVARA